MRSDAIRNRDQILEAGASVFLEAGLFVSLDAVIERAGVGKATFYRNFPDRTALIVALLESSIEQLETAKSEMTADDGQLFRLLSQVGFNLVGNPVLSDAWRFLGPDSEEKVLFESRLHMIFDIPIKNAIAAGILRPDLTCADILIVLGMLGAIATHKDAGSRKSTMQRCLDLISSGIRM